jgi:hypothetical protein
MAAIVTSIGVERPAQDVFALPAGRYCQRAVDQP